MALTDECKRSIEIEVPSGEVEREAARIAQGIQRKARIPGFRPGKAPLTLVRKHFGDKIREEVLETLVPAHLRSAFERESVEPVAPPTLEDLHFEFGEPIRFRANFEVLPAIELGDYRSIRTEMAKVQVDPGEVDTQLESLRERYSKTADAPDAEEAADGLMAVVEATRQEPDGGATEPQELAIEVNGPETLPQFTAALRGMKRDEERDLDVEYPAEYPNAAFAGKTLSYHLRLKRLERKTRPKLSDSFAAEATGLETVALLRERIEEDLLSQRRHEARHEAEEKVLDQLVGMSEFPVPEALVEKQIDSKLERNLRSLAEQGVDARKLNVDWSKLRGKYEEPARREVKIALLLERIAEAEKIEASPERIEAEVRRAAQELKQSPEALRARLTENGVLDRIKNSIRQERVLDFLLDQATGTQHE